MIGDDVACRQLNAQPKKKETQMVARKGSMLPCRVRTSLLYVGDSDAKKGAAENRRHYFKQEILIK
jgi:hypothetical protein